MTAPLRLLIIADVGGEEARHIGDEAMLEANLSAFRSLIPGVALTVVSRDPEWAAARYGVDAVAPFGFPGDVAAGPVRKAMLQDLLSTATNGGRKHATVEAVSSADGVVVSGGGNLSSTWPDLLYERVTLLQLARIFEKPAVVLGQTLGPTLNENERRLLAETLSTTRFVGLRELHSAALALELGLPEERLWYQCDDALFAEGLAGEPESASLSPTMIGSVGARTITITIDPQIRAAGEDLFGSLVSQLRSLAETTGARLVLIPHVFGDGSTSVPSDLTEASLLAERLQLSHTVIASGLDANRARKITGDAALVISSRYHPMVFALAAGVPALGIYGDDYCRIKVQGALAHARLERWAVTYDAVIRGELLAKSLELWDIRHTVARQLESCREAWREESRERWRIVLRALDTTATIPAIGPATMFGRPRDEMAAALVSAREARRVWQQAEGAAVERLATRRDTDAESRARWRERKGLLGTLWRRASSLRSKFRHSAH